MALRNVVQFETQTGITATSDVFVVDPAKEASAALVLTAGTPTTGAQLQVTLDEADKIAAGTAQWIGSPLGLRTTSGAEKVLRPVTGLRLVATDGTWTLQVRQA
ncbi:MAG: hypothetical protein WAZ18_06540 [Alphaproteobacteria bacterium]